MAHSPTVFECSYCSGRMQVDETRIPSGLLIQVRCPHCQKIGLVGSNGAAVQPEQTSGNTQWAVSPERAPRPPFVPPRPGDPGAYAEATGSFEPEPTDTEVSGFRFPSEAEYADAKQKRRKLVRWLIMYGLLSLTVIAFFALLVNIVLPGPVR